MLVFKCKMCGGDIQAEEGLAWGTCDSCGSTTTLPKLNDDKLTDLFNRADQLRRNNEFDRALPVYESVLNEDPTNAEVYWHMVLCRYGIEYVEDPVTHERVPTCHRMQFESILTDTDYLAALEHAQDSYTRDLYEGYATRINEIQKDYLAISEKEKPYDIFICYKETTDGGNRTIDSKLAQDLYDLLEKDGYRVFFARITLESILGEKYEPYIFAALNSAKVMLVIGTNKEHFNATWVKNEWSRYLALVKKDKSRKIITCYKDMDAYDLPNEFQPYQAQDMGKIGWEQDLLRGLKKVLSAAKSDAERSASNAAAATATIESLMKRGHQYLEDFEWNHADELFEEVLRSDPEYAPAHFGKLLAEIQVCSTDALHDYSIAIEKYSNFQKAVKYATEELKKELKEYSFETQKNELLQPIREADKGNYSLSAVVDYIRVFESLQGYKDTDNLKSRFETSIQNGAQSVLDGNDIANKYRWARDLQQLGTFAESDKLAAQLKENADKMVADIIAYAKYDCPKEEIGKPDYQARLKRAFDALKPYIEWSPDAKVCINELIRLQDLHKNKISKTDSFWKRNMWFWRFLCITSFISSIIIGFIGIDEYFGTFWIIATIVVGLMSISAVVKIKGYKDGQVVSCIIAGVGLLIVLFGRIIPLLIRSDYTTVMLLGFFVGVISFIMTLISQKKYYDYWFFW